MEHRRLAHVCHTKVGIKLRANATRGRAFAQHEGMMHHRVGGAVARLRPCRAALVLVHADQGARAT